MDVAIPFSDVDEAYDIVVVLARLFDVTSVAVVEIEAIVRLVRVDEDEDLDMLL